MRTPATILKDETRALLTRLENIRPIALQESTLPAAAISPQALLAIDQYIAQCRSDLKRRAYAYLRWLGQVDSLQVTPQAMHERYQLLRVQFNTVLSHFDVFADATTQRGEQGVGVWLSGLDAAAVDALSLPGGYFEVPPLLCYLDRGPGGAIRRARTRLPGGGINPVAVIRIPRERMIGAGVASSLVHEAGHQGAALLDLVGELRIALQAEPAFRTFAGRLFTRWISEIIADLWGVARVGVTATLGLMGVVGVPRPFQFRITTDDPHPAPFVRVLISCSFGERMYPDAQWGRLVRLWHAFYPTHGLDPELRRQLGQLASAIPALADYLMNFRPLALGGTTLGAALSSPDRTPRRLRDSFGRATPFLRSLCELPPTLALAILGQARADGKLSPEVEARALANLLTHWALSQTFQRARCSTTFTHRGSAAS